MNNNQREALGLISIFLFLFPSILILIVGIFYYPLVRIGLMRFMIGVAIGIYALIDANK